MELFKGDTKFVLSMEEFYDHLEDDTLDDLVYTLLEMHEFSFDSVEPIPFTEEDFMAMLEREFELTKEDERVLRHNEVLERHQVGF